MGWTNGARMGKLGCLAWLRRRLLAKSVAWVQYRLEDSLRKATKNGGLDML